MYYASRELIASQVKPACPIKTPQYLAIALPILENYLIIISPTTISILSNENEVYS